MGAGELTALERVLTTLGHREPDRVPLFLILTITGAKFAGTSIERYFMHAEQVADMQLRMRERYGHDCFVGFYYSSAEVEAFGGDTQFFADGPPNSGAPPIRLLKDIDRLAVPEPESTPSLARVLDTQRILHSEYQGRVPVIGVVVSPFSLPIMQMGFEAYLNLMFEHRGHFEKLMAVNEAFSIRWANAQLAAGADAICYFDPVSSPTIIPRAHYLETGHGIAVRTIGRINGPVATHFASGSCAAIMQDLPTTGTVMVGVSAKEDLAELKYLANGKTAILGNLNGVEMARWTGEQAEAKVKQAIAKAGRGGGFVLADNHGEIPWQVSDEVLMAISRAAHKWGRYPLDWVNDDEE